jgi:hypothetical protein
MKWIVKSVVRISILFVVLLQVAAWLFVDSLMFHPVKGGYDENLRGYVDIGTNGVKIAAVVRGPEKGKSAIIYCHGNAEDITSSSDFFDMFALDGYTVAAVDYPGYGLSDGKPDEAGCYRNVHRLYDWLVETRDFAPENIAVIGFSIGTGPAVELAATRKVGALILEAAYLSAPRIMTGRRVLFIDPFPNIERIEKINCPLLSIHGTADSIIPFSHGKRLFAIAKEPKQFVSVEGADHNDFIDVMGLDAYHSTVTGFLEGHMPDLNCLANPDNETSTERSNP